jgi:hypothetical protein
VCTPPSAPGAHATTHSSGGSDAVTISNLAGIVTDAQVNGANESDEVLLGGDGSGTAAAAVINEARYVPSDNADYGGSDPGNVDDALNYLAPRVRFALASNSFDAIADITTQTLWRRTKTNGPMTATSYAGNPCRAMQEALNYALTVTTPVDFDYNVGWFGEATAEIASDFYDQGPYRTCVAAIATSTSIGTGGTGGYSVNNANREGWPLIGTTNVPSNLSGLTVTSATSTTLTDNEISPGFNTLTGNFFYIEITSGTGSGQKRRIVSATSSVATIDLAWTTTPDATSVYRVFTVPFLANANIHVEEDYVLTIDQASQSEPAAVIQRGNGWASGFTGSGFAELVGSVSHLNFSGSAVITCMNEVASTAWLAGAMPEASASTVVTPDRALIFYLDIGYRRSQDATTRLIGCNTISNDNVGYYTAQNWGLERVAKGTIGQTGLAVKYHDNAQGTWASQYVSGVQLGISVGDVPNGGDSVPWSSCATGYCTPFAGVTAQNLRFDDWILESCDYGCLVAVDGGAEFASMHGESGTVLNHQWILGAVRCNGNAATEGRYVGETLDCLGGGTGTAHATSPVMQLAFTGQGFSPKTTSLSFAGLIVGQGATQDKGLISFGPEFVFGFDVLPANDPACASAGAPYWYCTGSGLSPSLAISGPRFPRVFAATDVRVQLMNSGRLTSEFLGTGAVPGILWPYPYYKFVNTNISEFTCEACDFNVTDALGRTGGFAPDGFTSANTDDYASEILASYHFTGNQTFTNTYFQKFWCVPGPWSDAGEASESYSIRPFLYNGTTSVAIAGAIILTEGTDTVGVPKSAPISANSDYFDFASGAAKQFTGSWGLGFYVSAETDATDNNLASTRCGVEYATLGNE